MTKKPPCEIDPEDTDYYRTRIVREELYKAEYKYEDWGELISSENGILTFYEGRVCPTNHWCVQERSYQTRCELNPWLELWDNVFEMQIHTSSGFVPDSSTWKYSGESVDREWISYTRTVCPKQHRAYADQSPEPGASTDYIHGPIPCSIDGTQLDTLKTWNVYMPTESPDPSWIVMDDDGAVVTYGIIMCSHETPAPEADFDTEATEDTAAPAAEATPTPEE